MELFTFSENNGKYVSVYATDLVSIMDEYETYHNDMIQFIQSLQDITNERVDNIDKFQKLLNMAKKADDIFDNYIKLSEVTEKTESARVSATIELYADSTRRFITSISDKFFSTMEMLFEVKDGKNPRKFKPNNGAYKLI